MLKATTCLKGELVADGERVMMKVERPDLWDLTAHKLADREAVEQLLERLQREMAV